MTVAIADDHKLVRQGIADMLKRQGLNVVHLAGNGQELLEYAQSNNPDVVLMDLNMPVMDGWETTKELQKSCPKTRVIALSMLADDLSIIKMLRCGARGYLLKDSEPEDLVKAIKDVHETGFYHSDLVSSHLADAISGQFDTSEEDFSEVITGRVRVFLQHACTELTYKEIADEMCVSPRTVDGYRDTLFQKYGLKSRVGLVIFAIRNNLVELHD